MNAPRTIDELGRVLREDLGSRKREIIYFTKLVDKIDPKVESAALRGAYAVLYAHWEGFVKTALQRYVDYVGQHKTKHEDFADAFVAMAIKKRLNDMSGAQSPTPYIAFVRWFRQDWGRRAHLPNREIISAQSNLGSTMFMELLSLVGLEVKIEYQNKCKDIDDLVDHRNALAHGEWRLLDAKDWRTRFRPAILDLMDMVCEDIENAARDKRHLFRP